jgi:hypothetical protein
MKRVTMMMIPNILPPHLRRRGHREHRWIHAIVAVADVVIMAAAGAVDRGVVVDEEEGRHLPLVIAIQLEIGPCTKQDWKRNCYAPQQHLF